MRVTQPGSNQVQSAETSSAKKATKSQAPKDAKAASSAGAADSAKSASSDGASATISSKAKDAAKAKEVATNAPDIREQKVAELKKRIASGEYSVDANAVADKMVNDHLAMG